MVKRCPATGSPVTGHRCSSLSVATPKFASGAPTFKLMNFGALLGFMFVNLSVIVHFFFRLKQRDLLRNLLVPALGFIICAYLWVNLSRLTLQVGFAWMTLGLVYAAYVTKGFRQNPVIYKE